MSVTSIHPNTENHFRALKKGALPLISTLVIGFLIGLRCAALFLTAKEHPPHPPRLKNLFESYFHHPFSYAEKYEPLAGGMTKSVWKVTYKGKAYIFKLFPKKDDILTMLQEGYYTAWAAGYEVGPALLALDLVNQGIIQEFVETEKKWEATAVHAMEKLRKFHKTIRYYPFASFHKRLDELNELGAPIIHPLKEAVLIADSWMREDELSLIHGDFHKSQLVGSGEAVLIIDFADTRIGDGFYDVAKFSFRDPNPEENLKAYLGYAPSQEELDHFEKMQALVYLDIATNRYLKWARKQSSFDEKQVLARYKEMRGKEVNFLPTEESLLDDTMGALAKFHTESERR